jgi:hypothetical protein
VTPVVADMVDRSARVALGLVALAASAARDLVGADPVGRGPLVVEPPARPPLPQAVPGAVLALGRRARRSLLDVVATTERSVAAGVDLVTRPAPVRALVDRVAEPVLALDREAATAVTLDRSAAAEVLRAAVQQAVTGVLDQIDLDEIVGRVDIDQIIAERVDIDRIIAEHVDIDRIVHRLDLDGIIAEQVDIDRIVHRLDIDRIIAEQVDIDSIIDAVDVGRVIDKLDLNAVVAEKVDLDAIIERVNVELVLDKLDFTAIVQERVDLAGLANDVVDDIELPELVRSSTSTIAGDTLDAVRRQGMTADDLVAKVIDRILLRRRRRRVDLAVPRQPEADAPTSPQEVQDP